MITCDKCGRGYDLVDVWPIHCICKNRIGLDRIGENKPTAKRPRPPGKVEFPCTHRGGIIRKIDCGCAGDSRVFACAIFGECMIRRLKPGQGPHATCNICERRDDG